MALKSKSKPENKPLKANLQSFKIQSCRFTLWFLLFISILHEKFIHMKIIMAHKQNSNKNMILTKNKNVTI